MEVEASGGEVVAVLPDDVDFDFDLDGLDGFDFDLDGLDGFNFDLDGLDGFDFGFCDGGGDHFFTAGDEKGMDEPAGTGLELGLSSPESGGGRERSPDSVVTDDRPAPLASSGSGEHDGSRSDYVSELERFLMEDDDDGGRKMEELDDDDYDYFFGDLLTGDGGAAPPVEEDSLAAAREDEATSRKRARQRRGALPRCQALKRSRSRGAARHLGRTPLAACSGCSILLPPYGARSPLLLNFNRSGQMVVVVTCSRVSHAEVRCEVTVRNNMFDPNRSLFERFVFSADFFYNIFSMYIYNFNYK